MKSVIAVKKYKNRKIEQTKPVEVYRNLRITPGIWYSIRQAGRVVAHTQNVTLKSVDFVVQEKGRRKVLRTKHKNVHAWIRGFISADYTELEIKAQVLYDPYKNKRFVIYTGQPIHSALRVRADATGVWATGIALW